MMRHSNDWARNCCTQCRAQPLYSNCVLSHARYSLSTIFLSLHTSTISVFIPHTLLYSTYFPPSPRWLHTHLPSVRNPLHQVSKMLNSHLYTPPPHSSR